MVHHHPGKVFLLVLVFIFLVLGCSLKHSLRTGEEFSRETNRLETLIRESADPSARGKLHRQLGELCIHHQNPGRNYGKALREFEAYLLLTPVEDRTEEAQNWIEVLRELERAEKETAQSTRIRENLVVENREKEEALNRQEKMLDLERKKNEELVGRLQTMQDLERKKDAEWQARLEEMEKANQNLSEANRSLKESTDRMKKTLERLKDLDVQMEEKRKAIR
jgi:hypothetical protein